MVKTGHNSQVKIPLDVAYGHVANFCCSALI